MSSTHTTLCIVNTTGMDITQIDISEIDNNDWDGDSRPDHNFQGVSIKNNDSRCESEEINDYASSCPYRMTLKFSNGTDLSFRNDQKDALTKINRSIYPDRGTEKDNLVAYQTSGGNTNAIYIRQKQEPDNSGWMGKLLDKKPDVRLNAITLPGSHDAGMYSTSNCTIGIEPAWTITQSCSIGDQLKIGSRYFDLRVYFDGENYRVGHFGNVLMANRGCYGPLLSDVINQVNGFIQSYAGKSETVILKFSHTMSDSPKDYPVDEVTSYVANVIKNVFGGYLYTSQNPGSILAQTPLQELSGKVVAVFGMEFQNYFDVTSGIFPYRDYPNEEGYGLRVYDDYSNTDSYSTMSKDQLSKLDKYGGYNNDYLFLLSWTLTGNSATLLDIHVLSILAKPWLPQILTQIKNGKLKLPNVVYYDYVDPYINRAIIDLNE